MADLKLQPFQRKEKLFSCSYWPADKKEWITFDELAEMVPPGWKALLEDLVVKLLALGWNGEYHQVKEKFGTLRFYWANNIEAEVLAEAAEDVVSYAELHSGWICADCGASGVLYSSGGWLSVKCLEHAAEGSVPVKED